MERWWASCSSHEGLTRGEPPSRSPMVIGSEARIGNWAREEVVMADPVVHFELIGVDREALGRFYAELFGWHVESVPEPPYSLIDTHAGSGINGGMRHGLKPSRGDPSRLAGGQQ